MKQTTIGQSITHAMNAQHKAVQPMAERLGISVSTITNIRKDRNYTKDSLYPILEDLGLEVLIVEKAK